MSIDSFYDNVINYLAEYRDSTHPQPRIDEVESALELDVDLIVDWFSQHNSISSKARKTISDDMKGVVKHIKDNPTEGLTRMKAILEHSFGVKRKPAEAENKGSLAKLLFKGLDPNDVSVWKKFIDNPEEHPEWIFFSHEVIEIFPDAKMEDVKEIFIQLMRGIVFELSNVELNKLREKIPDPYPAAPAASKGAETANLYASTRQIIGQKTLNPHYKEAFDKFQELDRHGLMFHGWGRSSDPSKREASLWTGGPAVSVFASKEYRVLEQSRLGSLFDRFAMHPDWKVQYPIWNLLSEGFVASDISRQIRAGSDPIVLNYHFRADDPNCIGQLIEIPTALSHSVLEEKGADGRKIVIKMVPLITDLDAKTPKQIVKPIEIEIDVKNFREQLKRGTSPLYATLGLLDEMSRNMALNPGAYPNELKALIDANAFAIKKHLAP